MPVAVLKRNFLVEGVAAKQQPSPRPLVQVFPPEKEQEVSMLVLVVAGRHPHPLVPTAQEKAEAIPLPLRAPNKDFGQEKLGRGSPRC